MKIEKDKMKKKLDLLRKKHPGQLYFYAERAFNMLANFKAIEVHGNFQYREKWIFDVLTHKMKPFIDEMRAAEEIPVGAPMIEFMPSNREELLGYLEILRTSVPTITFTDADVRKHTGMKYLTRKAIEGLIDNLNGCCVTGNARVFAMIDDELKLNYVKLDVGFYRNPITDIISIKEIRYRGGEERVRTKRVWAFNWTYFMLLAFSNIANGAYTWFPQKFYKLKKTAQEIYRAVMQFPMSTLPFKQIVHIVGYSEAALKNTEQTKKFIVDGLNELEEKKFIVSWYSKRDGRETEYHIIVRGGLEQLEELNERRNEENKPIFEGTPLEHKLKELEKKMV